MRRQNLYRALFILQSTMVFGSCGQVGMPDVLPDVPGLPDPMGLPDPVQPMPVNDEPSTTASPRNVDGVPWQLVDDAPLSPSDLVPVPIASCDDAHWSWENPQPHGNAFSGVWGAAANDLWATTGHGEVFHFDGARWNCEQRLPAQPTSIHGCGPRDIWIAGVGGALAR